MHRDGGAVNDSFVVLLILVKQSPLFLPSEATRSVLAK